MTTETDLIGEFLWPAMNLANLANSSWQGVIVTSSENGKVETVATTTLREAQTRFAEGQTFWFILCDSEHLAEFNQVDHVQACIDYYMQTGEIWSDELHLKNIFECIQGETDTGLGVMLLDATWLPQVWEEFVEQKRIEQEQRQRRIHMASIIASGLSDKCLACGDEECPLAGKGPAGLAEEVSGGGDIRAAMQAIMGLIGEVASSKQTRDIVSTELLERAIQAIEQDEDN